MTTRFLVVGGDAAGMSAAAKAKRDSPDTEVVVFERGDWVSYGACGLPYYIEGSIDHLNDLVVVQPERVIEKHGIDLRRHQEVSSINRDDSTVTVETVDGPHTEAYDNLLLATGGRASRPSVPGHDLEGVFTVRNLAAGRALRNYIVPEEAPPIPEVQHGYAEEWYLNRDLMIQIVRIR